MLNLFPEAYRVGEDEGGICEDCPLSSLSTVLLSGPEEFVSTSRQGRELGSIRAATEGETCIWREGFKIQLGGRTLPAGRAGTLEPHTSFKHKTRSNSFDVADMQMWKTREETEVNSFPPSLRVFNEGDEKIH